MHSTTRRRASSIERGLDPALNSAPRLPGRRAAAGCAPCAAPAPVPFTLFAAGRAARGGRGGGRRGRPRRRPCAISGRCACAAPEGARPAPHGPCRLAGCLDPGSAGPTGGAASECASRGHTTLLPLPPPPPRCRQQVPAADCTQPDCRRVGGLGGPAMRPSGSSGPAGGKGGEASYNQKNPPVSRARAPDVLTAAIAAAGVRGKFWPSAALIRAGPNSAQSAACCQRQFSTLGRGRQGRNGAGAAPS